MHIQHRLLFAAVTAALSFHAAADTRVDTTAVTATLTTTPETNMLPAPADSGTPASRLTSQFATWAGSPANASSLVTGLRTGTPITLQSTTAAPAETVTFTPPTQTMGWGNVTKSLSLAQANLAAQGITTPTPLQLQTALTGGDLIVVQGTSTQTVHMDGILTMRSQGMGWGEIAHNLNLQPGATFRPSGAPAAEHALQTGEHDHDTPHAGTELHSGQHVEHRAVTAGGTAIDRTASASGRTEHAHDTRSRHLLGHDESHASHQVLSRVVTAAGTPMASGATFRQSGSGHSQHAEFQHVSHITTASGAGFSAGNGNGGSHGHDAGHGRH